MRQRKLPGMGIKQKLETAVALAIASVSGCTHRSCPGCNAALRVLAAAIGDVLGPEAHPAPETGGEKRPHPLDERKEPCPGCGHRSRITTAGCDRCDYEDK